MQVSVVGQSSFQEYLMDLYWGHFFSIYIDDLFYLTDMTDACNYAGDATFHPRLGS